MPNKIIKHNEGLKALWVDATNIDDARNIAVDFLKELETSDYEFKISRSNPCKKNSNLIKIEYSSYTKKGSRIDIQRDILYSRKYSLEIIDEYAQIKKTIIDGLDTVEKNIQDLTIDKCNSIYFLSIGCKLTLNYYQDYDGEIVNETYNIIRLS